MLWKGQKPKEVGPVWWDQKEDKAGHKTGSKKGTNQFLDGDGEPEWKRGRGCRRRLRIKTQQGE